MSLTAFILVLISAFIHAGWNLVSKSRKPTAAFFLLANLAGTLFLALILLAYPNMSVGLIPARVWILLGVSGFFLALYYISLAGAYRSGDMSVAYPLARSSPVIVVTIVTLGLGRGDQVTTQCVIGILVVAAGCFLIPMRRFSDLRLGNYLNMTCAMALLAAIGTAGYSIVDDEALRLFRSAAGESHGIVQITILYACLEAAAGAIWLSLFIMARQKERTRLINVLRSDKLHSILAGVAIYTCYAMILISLAFVKNVSYVVGLRQISIPLGTILAMIFLGEPPRKPRLAGAVVMFAGLVMIATG